MNQLQDRLDLDSRLDELSRVHPWIEDIADRHRLGENVRFAIHLCIEEALANVILHGYRSEPGNSILLLSCVSGNCLLISIEDKAPHFAPDELSHPASPTDAVDLETVTPGGNGIRLMRRFALSLTYETLQDGNRLTMTFPLPSI